MEHGLVGAEDVEIDYESLPSQPLRVTMVAGAAAGMLEHLVMYPFDSVKSLCPCPEKKLNPVSGLWSMAMREGWWRPLKGMPAVAVGAVPAHALYFSVYEHMKHRLTQGKLGHNQTLSYGLAGVTATIFHDAVMNPAEVVKQRMQMWGSPYSGSLQCARCIWKAEGGRAFYRSYATQLSLNIPFQSIHFMVYEFWQQILNERREYNPSSHIIAGAWAGGVAAAITTPLDVVKTVLNTQQSATAVNLAAVPHSTVYDPLSGQPCPKGSSHAPPPTTVRVTFPGFTAAMSSIWASRGVAGFFSGALARVMVQTPATAVSWSVYEFAKWILHIPPPTTSALPPSIEAKLPASLEFEWSESQANDGWTLISPQESLK